MAIITMMVMTIIYWMLFFAFSQTSVDTMLPGPQCYQEIISVLASGDFRLTAAAFCGLVLFPASLGDFF